ncbi:MAG: hypothetical protein ACKVPJ_03860, partial [Chitinophagales bacterium]
LTEFYNADIVFTTGTMGELVLVEKIDGRKISDKQNGDAVFKKIFDAFRSLTETEGVTIPK